MRETTFFLTSCEKMGDAEPAGEATKDMADASCHLHESVENAVVLRLPGGKLVAVWHVSHEDPSDDAYFYQEAPIEEPDASIVGGPSFLHELLLELA